MLLKETEISREIVQADSMVVLTHFKGHEVSGFGGAIKNLAMGCSTKGGKLRMHSPLKPKVREEKCTGCFRCIKWCNFNAIDKIDNKIARIDLERCTGCAECIGVCPESIITIKWDNAHDFNKLMVEYAYGAIKNKTNKVIYVNFLMNISPECDCYPRVDAPIVPDIGIVASLDIVAVEKASYDLVTKSEGLANSKLGSNIDKGVDKFKALYPSADTDSLFNHAENIGLGTTDYELIEM